MRPQLHPGRRRPQSSTYEQEAEEEELLIGWYLSQGDIVTVPDFEGTGLHWMAGAEVEAPRPLDAIRATGSRTWGSADRPRRGCRATLGRSVAADWAAELAPTHMRRSSDLVGVAMGGIPVNYIHMFDYAQAGPRSAPSPYRRCS